MAQERKLAYIVEIDKLLPMYNADNLELATLKDIGWQVVVKKKEFSEGDKCIYCEIDSVLPEKPEFEFLRQRKFRIKTAKIRGIISQGIIFPMDILDKDYEIDEDVTEAMGIIKYEPKIKNSNGNANLAGRRKGNFPIFLRKTDELRVQTKEIMTLLNDEETGFKWKSYYISVKYDGSSATFYNNNGEFGVCSRNINLDKTDKNEFWKIAIKYDIEKILEGTNLCIQGELVGPGIQGNRLGLKEYELYVFNVYNIKTQKYYGLKELEEFCKINNLQMVDVIERCYEEDIKSGKKKGFNYNLTELLKLAKGVYPNGHKREGIVIRETISNYHDRLHGRMSFKVIDNDYLIKTGT